jgi:hypothetical protein
MRWAELELAHVTDKENCISNLLSSRVRVEQWQPGEAPQPSYTHPAWRSEFPDYLEFDSKTDASGMEMFVPRDPSSGLRTISCVIGSHKCWVSARDEMLLIKWPIRRQLLSSGLERDWRCVRQAVEMLKVD